MFFYVLAAVIRLGYFNVQEMNRVQVETGKRKYYVGLPVTTASLLIPCMLLLDIPTKFSVVRFYNIALLILGLAFLSKLKVKKAYMNGLIVLTFLGALVFFLMYQYGDRIVWLPSSITNL